MVNASCWSSRSTHRRRPCAGASPASAARMSASTASYLAVRSAFASFFICEQRSNALGLGDSPHRLLIVLSWERADEGTAISGTRPSHDHQTNEDAGLLQRDRQHLLEEPSHGASGGPAGRGLLLPPRPVARSPDA